MPQITFRLPEDEKEFLKWYAEKTAQPISTVYRNVTMEYYQKWKEELLLEEYKKGSINIKKFCTLTNKSFHETLLLLEKKEIEPPITKVMDEYTSTVRKKIKTKDLFKKNVNIERESPVVDN